MTEQVTERGLATFQDQEEQTVQYAESAVPFFKQKNPYPDQTARQIMSRWYSIDSKTLTKTTAEGEYILNPFYSLFNQNILFETAKSFRYFRYKYIELRIQQSTTPQIYGWAGYASYPKAFMPSGGTFSSMQLRPHLSFDDCVLFDIAIQNDVTSLVPWRSPEQWCDWYEQFQLGTNNYIDLNYNRCCLFWPANPIHVLQSTAAPSVTFVVFARFVDPELSGHIDGTDDYYAQASYIPLVKSVVKGVSEVSSLIDDPIDYFSRKSPEGAYRDIVMPVLNAFSPEKSVEPTIPKNDPDLRNNPYGSVTFSTGRYVAGTGTQLAPSGDYSVMDIIRMPTAVEYGNVLYSDTLFSLITSATQHLVPGAHWGRIGYMSQLFRMWRGSQDFTLVLFSSPFISARFNVVVSWGKTAPTGTIGNEIVKDVTVRGTTIVHFTVPFLSPSQWGTTWFVSQSSKDNTVPRIYLKVIEAPVNPGDVQCSIPYILYERAGEDFCFRGLMSPMRTMTPALGSPEPEKEYFAQMEVRRVMGAEVTGGGAIPAQPNGAEGERTILEMCQRWSGRHMSSTYSSEPFPIKGPLSVGGTIHVGVFDTISSLFCFWSGQIRIKASLVSGTPDIVCWHTPGYLNTSLTGGTMCQKPEDGMVNIDPSLTKVLDVTAPFLSDVQFVPIFNVGITGILNSLIFSSLGSYDRKIWTGYFHDHADEIVSPNLFYIAGGNDYTLYLPIPPPERAVWPIFGDLPSGLETEFLTSKSTHVAKTKQRSSSSTSCTLSESFESV